MVEIIKNQPVFILGAGFSKCADLPIQSEFSSLLTSDEFSDSIDIVITSSISTFLKDVFGWESGKDVPSLEDIFTFIDLSAGTGHHLGIKYTPKMLRALRRMLIYRTFQIIDHRYKYSNDIEKLLSKYLETSPSFIVINWDIVLEKHIRKIDNASIVNYIIPCFDWDNQKKGNTSDGIKICKIHGSSNWVYCENCKTLYYHLDEKLSLHKKVGLIKSDFRLYNEKFTNGHFDNCIGLNPEERKCKICNNGVASHIATFSYRKSFRTFAYPAIWYEAENLLANSQKWIFIGYSLPEADFELKHLIKSAQLRLKHKKINREIDVIVYKDTSAIEKYIKFFGENNINGYNDGLSDYINKL